MPIYIYRCSDCSHVMEKLVFDRKELVECASCGSKNSKRQLTSFNTLKHSSSHGNSCCEQRDYCKQLSCDRVGGCH